MSFRRGTSHEISTVGFDQNLQTIGSDPYGSAYFVGISVPTTVLPKNGRYLFMLALSRIGANEKARLVGIRQLVTIVANIPNGVGAAQTIYPLELQVFSPFWHFTDANISWHLKKVAPLKRNTNNAFNAEGLQFQYAQTPALLFQKAPAEAGGYVAPYGGIPPGNNLLADLSNFHDLRFPWQSSQTWSELDTEFEGPCDIALFASVKQTDPATRPTLPVGLTDNQQRTMPEEDRFVYNFPQTIYGRIAGSLVFERNNQYPDPQQLSEKTPPFRRSE